MVYVAINYAEFEALRERMEVWEEGYQAGQDSSGGYKWGYDQGHEKGWDEGYEDGWENGQKALICQQQENLRHDTPLAETGENVNTPEPAAVNVMNLVQEGINQMAEVPRDVLDAAMGIDTNPAFNDPAEHIRNLAAGQYERQNPVTRLREESGDRAMSSIAERHERGENLVCFGCRNRVEDCTCA